MADCEIVKELYQNKVIKLKTTMAILINLFIKIIPMYYYSF
jgi:hypothetical protein